ncbi:MAG: cation diffusion facilitator family transporter [candidate division Zixibacteria bacterium]|nr:cation diffusion facilitator family transporter [candidate division Zixibacteria bacterium]
MSAHNHNNNFKPEPRVLVIPLLLTALMTLVEFFGGILSGSLSLIGDAGHMLTDTLALALSFFALKLSRRPADAKRTYGFHRTEILVALLNGVTLIFISGYIFYEAYKRFLAPPQIKAPLMLSVAAIGLVVNIIGILILKGSSKTNLNIRGAFMHVLGDALSSIGVIVAGIIIFFTKFYLIDPIVAILIGGIILRGAINLITESSNILLEAVPKHLRVETISEELIKIRGIKDMHDLHLWTISSGIYALSGHLVIEDQMVSKSDQILTEANKVLQEKFGITHTTLQMECLACSKFPVCNLGQ